MSDPPLLAASRDFGDGRVVPQLPTGHPANGVSVRSHVEATSRSPCLRAVLESCVGWFRRGPTCLLVGDDDPTIARVYHEDGKQLGRLGSAGILADLMMIARR